MRLHSREHCTHVSIDAMNAASTGAPLSSTSRIAAIRPRGDSDSSPETWYAGSAEGRDRTRRTRRARLRRPAECRAVGARPAPATLEQLSCDGLRHGQADRPGENFPVGSNATRIRSCSTALPVAPHRTRRDRVLPPRAGASLRQPRRRCAAGRRDRPPESAATCTVPTPTSASQRTWARSRADASAGSTEGRTEIRPRCVPSGKSGATLLPTVPIARRSASTSAATPSTSTTCFPGPVRQHTRRPVAAAQHRDRVFGGRAPFTHAVDGLAPERDLREHAESPEGAHDGGRRSR